MKPVLRVKFKHSGFLGHMSKKFEARTSTFGTHSIKKALIKNASLLEKLSKIENAENMPQKILLGATKIGDLARELRKQYIFFGRSSELDTWG
jgi:hypothetical protein